MGVDASLTAQTVQPLLQKWFPGAKVSPYMTPLAADASTRRYVRVVWDVPGAGQPASCILMICDPWKTTETPDFLAVGRHLHACGIRVPRVYGISPLQGLICLEDYGDRTLAAQWQYASAERLLWGQRAIDELVQLHTVGTQRYDPACPAFHLLFDVPKLLSELQFFRQHALEGLWQQPLTAAARDAWDAACTPLCALLAAQPRYFCHRDYHGWNIMVLHGAIGLLDFQDARLGPQPYDLVSLLLDRGTPGMLGAEVSRALIDYYIRRFEAEESRQVSRADFTELFEHVAVQRCLKAVGTFAYLGLVRQRQQYLQYIPATLVAIKPLLRRYNALQPLTQLLHRYIPHLIA